MNRLQKLAGLIAESKSGYSGQQGKYGKLVAESEGWAVEWKSSNGTFYFYDSVNYIEIPHYVLHDIMTDLIDNPATGHLFKDI